MYKNIAESLYVISVKGKPRIPNEMMISIIGIVGLILQNLFLSISNVNVLCYFWRIV